MKKIISLVLALIMVLTMVAVSVSATGNTLTRNEAITLAGEAYKFIFFAQESTGFEGEYLYDITFNYIYPIDVDYENVVYFDESMDGKKYAGKHEYYLVKKVESPYEDLNTYEAIVEKANSIFSDYLVKKVLKVESFYDNTPGANKKEYVDCFRKGENGELYTSVYIQPLEAARSIHITKFGALNVNGSNATLGVTLTAVGWASTDSVDAIFEFVKTDKGWRVCNGSAVSYIFREIKFPITDPNIPETGDNSGIMIPALAVLAVISIAIPVGMRKRRRER